MKKIEETVYKFLKARKWDNLRPSDIAKSIMIEGAELLEHFQWENAPLEVVKKDKKKLEEIKKELADVLLYATYLSVLLGFDTEKIMRNKLALAAKKYPAKIMRKQIGEPGTEKSYLDIKKNHRKNTK